MAAAIALLAPLFAPLATGSFWVGLGVNLGLSAGASFLIGRMTKKPTRRIVPGTELDVTGDPVGVRAVCYGEGWTGGTLRFRWATGTENKDFYMVIVLAGHEITAVTAVEANRELLTIDGSGNVTAPDTFVANGVALMNIRFVLGTDSQAADATLMAEFGGAWTADHRLRGLAYAIIRVSFDEQQMNSLPSFRFKVKGRKVYDPRLDDTNGGTGPHRLADPATWEWSRNAILCANDFLRGVSINSIDIAGLGLAATRFDWANVIAEANVCDESVALDVGGTEARYTCDGFIDPNDNPDTILEAFESAIAGEILPSDGKWRFYCGAYRTPTLALTDQHFIGPLRHVVHKGELDRVDTATGRYGSFADSGSTVNYAPVRLASATPGDEREAEYDFQLVADTTDTPGTYDGGARAQRIAKLLLEKESAGKQIHCQTNLYGLRAIPGETITITHAAFGLSSQVMRVIEVQLRVVAAAEGGTANLIVDLVLEAGPASLYTWAAEETTLGAGPLAPQYAVPPVVVPVGAGAYINSDPATSRSYAWETWTGENWEIAQITDGKVGNTELRSTTAVSGDAWVGEVGRYAVDTTKSYKLHAWLRRKSGDRAVYLACNFYDASGALIAGSNLGWAGWGTTFYWVFALDTTALPADSVWREFTATFGGYQIAQIPASAKTMALGAILNAQSGGTTDGVVAVQDLGVKIHVSLDDEIVGALRTRYLDAYVQAALGDTPDNMLQNGGGEEGTVDTQATGWTLYVPTGSAALAVAEDQQRIGSRSLRTVNATALDSFSYQQVSSLYVGAVYELSGWIKTTALSVAEAGEGAFFVVAIVSGGSGGFQILEKVGSSPDPATPDVGLAATGSAIDWTFVRSRFKVLGSDAVVNVRCQLGYNGGITGTAWWDGLVLRRLRSIIAGDIVADSITATEIASSFIWTKDMTISTGGKIRTGKTTAEDTTAGFWLGWDGSATHDFHIGDADGYMRWDGSANTLYIKGDLQFGSIGSFTVTWYDFTDEPTDSDMYYIDAGAFVILFRTTQNLGTSDGSGYFAWSGIPAALCPSITRYVPCTAAANGDVLALAQVQSDGVVHMHISTTASGQVRYSVLSWPAAGNQMGLPSGFLIIYPK